MRTYICFGPRGKRAEVTAETSYAAQLEAARVMKLRASEAHKVTVTLADVPQSTGAI